MSCSAPTMLVFVGKQTEEDGIGSWTTQPRRILAMEGIHLRGAGVESPGQIGRAERRGGL
eukprot:5993429-Pyramimonas_sp.AAC.1